MDCRLDQYSRLSSLSEGVDACQHFAGALGQLMRDLILRSPSAALPVPPKGLSFAIADLVLAGAWAASQGYRMTIRLDHGDITEEYEEVIEFRGGRRGGSRLILWRSAEAVFVQPMPGKRRRHASVAEALESLHRTPRGRLTNIVTTTWPD